MSIGNISTCKPLKYKEKKILLQFCWTILDNTFNAGKMSGRTINTGMTLQAGLLKRS